MANASRWLPVVAALLGAGLTGLSAPAASAAGPGGFVGTWAASPMLNSTSSLAKSAAVASYHTPQGDSARMQVNSWIRTSGAAVDLALLQVDGSDD